MPGTPPSSADGEHSPERKIETLDDVEQAVVDVAREISAIEEDDDAKVLKMKIWEVGLDSLERADFACRVEKVLGYIPRQTRDVHRWIEESGDADTTMGQIAAEAYRILNED